ncbi:unnamed protein product [Rotaria sp. Silwood1]|nr:unnamed protein product [Rotaria sp. Silwood1]
MKAAFLGHQYLTVKSINENNVYFNSGGLRSSRKYERIHSKQQPTTNSIDPPISASDPLSHRSITTQKQSESNVPSVAIIERSYSDSNDLCVVSDQQSSIDTQFRHHVERKRDEDEKLSGRVRHFYKKQDALIDSFKELDEQTSFQFKKDNEHLNKQKRHTDWLIKTTLILNVTLLIAKIIAAVFSRSLSIISSVVDSAVDSASACLLFWVLRVIKRRDPYTYPGGRTRLEPLIIVILSVIMISASVQVIYESVQSLINYVNYFTKKSTSLRHIEMGPAPITVMCVTIISKAILSFLCYQIPNPTMYAVAQDHRNDVFSNIIALACGIIASKALDGSIKAEEVVVLDPIGAILISFYIIFCWLGQLREQVRNLSGYKAQPEFLQKITWLTLQHSPLIKKIDTVRAFHFGTSFLVEVEIILPETMSLKQAHDISDGLKNKLESISEVERAFVHLDYVVDALEY